MDIENLVSDLWDSHVRHLGEDERQQKEGLDGDVLDKKWG